MSFGTRPLAERRNLMDAPPQQKTEKPLEHLLNAVFDRLSHRIAGGRQHPDDLLPGADDPMEGIVPDEYEPEMTMFDWFDPTVWARATEDQMNVDLAGIQAASGPGREGKGLDWFRSGEAPNNYANRHNPLYKARREFAIQIAPKIEEMFGVRAGGVGYMRPPKSSDRAKGGRSSNSDHYSGGAIDFYGTKEEMVALRNWAKDQPWCSFIRCQSESHYDHVHISFDIGWIAQNYFKGREIPPLSNAASPRRASVSTPDLPDTRTPELGASAVPPPVRRGRPS